MALRVSALSKHFGRIAALDEVSFHLERGEILGLIGPNGAGKTTLFECIAGLLPPDSGAIEVEGRQLRPDERHTALFHLPDAIAPWPSQTVRWALDFAIGFLGGRAELRDETIALFALQPMLDARIGTLSKGQRKRAMLALGVLTSQPVLLADEPFEGLDLRQGREVATALRAYAGRGRTLFLSIHQIWEAARLCDRFVLLSGGRVRGEGTLPELCAAAGLPPGDSPATLEQAFLALT